MLMRSGLFVKRETDNEEDDVFLLSTLSLRKAYYVSKTNACLEHLEREVNPDKFLKGELEKWEQLVSAAQMQDYTGSFGEFQESARYGGF